MNFIFYDKDEIESDVITGILKDEKIPFTVKEKSEKYLFFFDDEDVCSEEKFYDITCYTDLEHFDYVKYLSDKKIGQIDNLERLYLMKVRKKKNVQRISKKGIADTDKGNKSK